MILSKRLSSAAYALKKIRLLADWTQLEWFNPATFEALFKKSIEEILKSQLIKIIFDFGLKPEMEHKDMKNLWIENLHKLDSVPTCLLKFGCVIILVIVLAHGISTTYAINLLTNYYKFIINISKLTGKHSCKFWTFVCNSITPYRLNRFR